MVSLWNRNPAAAGPLEFINAILQDPVVINPGDRIAQILFVPVANASLKVVGEFGGQSERGEGGFGSTGNT